MTTTTTATATTTTILQLPGFCPVLPERAGTKKVKPKPTWINWSKWLWEAVSSAYSGINLRAWQSFSTISFQVFFGLPLGLAPSTSHSTHFFTQSLSAFQSTCPYHRNLFCCSVKIMSSNPSLSLNPSLGTLSCSLMPHIQSYTFKIS